MGIQGLLGILKPLIKDCHVEQFRGKRVAVDGYCWLHKATYSCSIDLCNGVDNQAWIKYFLNMVDMLVFHDIEVFIVFDGKNLPAKQLVEASRGSSRQASLQKAREFEAAQDMKNAYIYYSRAVNVTPAMAARLIKIMKSSHPKVNCIVAPYEADAQLSYLSINNLVDLIISEDSDHVPYGCKDILFKLDGSGNCQRLLVSDIYSTPLEGFDLRTFTPEMTLIMCIISGCDYLNSVKGVGLKNSYKLVSKQRSAASVLRNMRITGLLPLSTVLDAKNNYSSDVSLDLLKLLPSNLLVYEFEFYKALTTFHHQAIYDPVLRKIKHMSPIIHSALPQCLQTLYPLTNSPSSTNQIIDVSLSEVTVFDPPPLPLDLPFLGSILVTDEVAVAIAEGVLDPSTREPFNLPEYLERPLSRNGSTGSLRPPTPNNNHYNGGSSNSSNANGIKKSTTLPSHMTSYKNHYSNQYNSSTRGTPTPSATVSPSMSVAEARQKAAASVSIINKLKSHPTITASPSVGGAVFGSAHKAMLDKASSNSSIKPRVPSAATATTAAAASVRRTVTPSSKGATSFYSYDSNGVAVNHSSADNNKRKGSQPINSFFNKTPKVDSSTPAGKGSSTTAATSVASGGVAFVTPSSDATSATAPASNAANEFDIYSVITIHSSASNSPIIESRKTATSVGKAPLHPNRPASSSGGTVKVSPYFANLTASDSLKKLNSLKINQAQKSLNSSSNLLASPTSPASRGAGEVVIDLTPSSSSEGTTQESQEGCYGIDDSSRISRDSGSGNGAVKSFTSFGYDESFSPPVPANKAALYSTAAAGLGTTQGSAVECSDKGTDTVGGNPFEMFQCES